MSTPECSTFDRTPEPMNCMEVWGGNGTADQRFAMPGLEVWVWSRPWGRSGVDGGDVHFISSCASGRITRMVLADICGQSTVFSDLSAALRDLMMRNVNAIKQARFEREMHTRLRDFSDRGGFATALISTFFAPTRSFALCNAGHPCPLIYRAAHGSWERLKSPPAEASHDDVVPPGVLEPGEYQQISTQLEDGDMVLGYSSVLAECRDPAGQVMGTEGLLRMVEQLNPQQPGDVLARLIDRVSEENAERLGEHDATLLLCRATTRGVGWRNNLLAPWRLLGRVSDNTRLR